MYKTKTEKYYTSNKSSVVRYKKYKSNKFFSVKISLTK